MAKKTKRNGIGTHKGTCFVIMPFGGWLDEYYAEIYCPAIEATGLSPHRADDLFRPSTIVHDIWHYSRHATLMLADLTGKNPNVFYELGLAHALAKPVILIADSMEDIPFDLRALRIIIYDKNEPSWGRALRDKIQSSIEEVLETPLAAVLPTFLEVKDDHSKPSVSKSERELIEIRQELDLIKRELRTPSSTDDSAFTSASVDVARTRPAPPTAAELEALLTRFRGNMLRVSRELDRKPALIYRWAKRFNLTPDKFRPQDPL